MKVEYIASVSLRFDAEADRDAFYVTLRTYIASVKTSGKITYAVINKTERSTPTESSEVI